MRGRRSGGTLLFALLATFAYSSDVCLTLDESSCKSFPGYCIWNSSSGCQSTGVGGSPTTAAPTTAVPTTDDRTATKNPTVSPTHGPTDTPTHGPTDTPTHGPTDTPTHGPTDTPTHGPTDTPTHGPTTSEPTHGPTPDVALPTRSPTTSPTPRDPDAEYEYRPGDDCMGEYTDGGFVENGSRCMTKFRWRGQVYRGCAHRRRHGLPFMGNSDFYGPEDVPRDPQLRGSTTGRKLWCPTVFDYDDEDPEIQRSWGYCRCCCLDLKAECFACRVGITTEAWCLRAFEQLAQNLPPDCDEFRTKKPTVKPTFFPTSYPTQWPTSRNSEAPTNFPSLKPTKSPSNPSPTEAPTPKGATPTPTLEPISEPTFEPTFAPTSWPTTEPTPQPTSNPTPPTPPTTTASPSAAPSTFNDAAGVGESEASQQLSGGVVFGAIIVPIFIAIGCCAFACRRGDTSEGEEQKKTATLVDDSHVHHLSYDEMDSGSSLDRMDKEALMQTDDVVIEI